MEKIEQYVLVAGRLLIALMFVSSGISKIFAYEMTQGYMDAMGVPGGLLPLVILTEAVGGLFLIVGFQTRITAFLLAGFAILSALLFHNNFADQNEMINFMKNLSISGGLFFVMIHGAGALSLDAKFKRTLALA